MNRLPIRTCGDTLLTMCAGQSASLQRPRSELPSHLADRSAAAELSRTFEKSVSYMSAGGFVVNTVQDDCHFN